MQIRAADSNDSSRCAEIHVLARRLMSYLSEKHTPAEVRAWKRYVVFARQSVWVAEIDREIVGYASLEGRDLTNLYVHPDYQRRGVGSALLARVQAIASEGLQLWTFQQNEGAIRFYERNGFHILTTTDGSEIEERVPACLMSWRTTALLP